MAQAEDTVWLPVLPSMKGFGPALVKGSGAESDKAGSEAGKRFGKAMVVGVTAVGVGALAAGAALYKVGEVFDDVADTIRVGTGATGKDLDALVDSAKRVGATVPVEFESIGPVVSDINTRMGLTGETLETVASQYLHAGNILGEAVDVNKTSAAFSAFKIEGEDVIGAMDHLFQVSQATGIGMNELADGAARNAPAMEILGFSFEETTAMIGSFDKAGLNSSALMASMSKGMVTLAKDGEEPAAAFKRVQEEITGFISAGDDAAALELASKVFGTKGASQFIGAVKDGALNLGDMSKAAGQTSDTIIGAGEDTMDFAEQWMLFKNKILVWLEPAASAVFGAIGTLMGEITGGVEAFGAAWAYNDGEITSSGIPGLMEQLGFYARQTFDYFQGTVIPSLQRFGEFLVENQDTIKVLAGVIGVLLLPIFVRLGVEALISGAKQVAGWAMAGGGAVKTSALYVINSYKMIGTWVALGLAAIKSGAETAAIWLMYRLDSLKAMGAMMASKASIIGSWIAMSAAAVLSGIQTAAVWTGTIIRNAVAGAISFGIQVGLVVGGWVLMGVQSLIQGARMAAAWILAMGPVGWVIAAVIGLVALIIANWDTVSSWTKTAWEAITGWIVSAWQNIVSFTTVTWATITGIFTGIVNFVRNVFAAVFTWLKDYVIQPVFLGIQLYIQAWWFVVSTIFNVVRNFVMVTLAGAFTWFRDSVIVPVFNGIQLYIQAWWFVVSTVFNVVRNFIMVTLAGAFTWFRDSVIVPVFNGIQLYIQAWWFVVSTVFNVVRDFIMVTLAGAFTWFRDSVIVPVFNGIRDTIASVWENGIRPVFGFLADTVTKTIPEAFQKGVDGAKRIWEGLQDIAKKPVKFVVETIINKGLIGAFNKVASFLPGIGPLNEVVLPYGFARGGILPGTSSWRNGDDQLVPMRRGEGVLMSEVMRDPFERARLYAMNKAALAGRSMNEARSLLGDGFAKGGIFNPLKSMAYTQGYNRVHKGVDLVAPVGTPVYATENGAVSWSGPGAQAPGVWGGNEIHIDGASGIQSWFAHLSSMAVKVGDAVRAGQQIALSGNTGISSGPHLHFGAFTGGWPNDIDPGSYLGGAGEPKGGWFNPLGALAGLADGVMKKVMDAIPGGGFMVDVAAGIGKKLITDVGDWAKDKLGMGAVTGIAGAHLDPLLYDQGGILRPGLSNIVNATREPEYILNPKQWGDIHHLATQRGGGGFEYSPTYQYMGEDVHKVMAKDKRRMRDTLAAHGIR